MSFEQLGLSDEVLRAVAEAGYEEPTPIQKQAIPQVLMGRDVLGIAQTGTGKTAAFTLPIIDVLAQGRTRARMPRCLILEPTRELAAQVADSFEKYGKYQQLTMALLIGGVSFERQEQALNRGPDFLIATPGRLLDQFERGNVLLNGVEILVVDECDRMLDMGFIPDVESICAKITKRHQSLFFSATLAKEIKRLTDKFLSDPKEIAVAPPSTTVESVEQFFVPADARKKKKTFLDIIEKEEIQNAIIFCNRKKDVDSLAKALKQSGLSVQPLHGDLPQSKRMDVLAAFKNDEITYLVASDVAARGLDIPRVSHIFNYDIPANADDYVHRIGRTGRAGRKGRAFTFVSRGEQKYADAIEERTKQKIPEFGKPGSGKPAKKQAQKDHAGKDHSGKDHPGKGQAQKDRAEADSGKDKGPPAGKKSAKKKPDRNGKDQQPAPESGKGRNKPADKNGKPVKGGRPDKDKSSGGKPKGLGEDVPAFLRQGFDKDAKPVLNRIPKSS